MIRKTQRYLSSTDSSSSDAPEQSRLPSEVLRLGARIVRELELEQSVDTLGRWMAHHLAEVMQEAESAEGGDKELARESAVDLILKLWSHKQSLPNGAYPLNDLKTVMSVVGQLSPEDSPFSRRSSDETEKLLARIFDGLRLVVAHSVILIPETRGIPDDLDAVAPFLEEDERQLIEVVEGLDRHSDRRRKSGLGLEAGRNGGTQTIRPEIEIGPNFLQKNRRADRGAIRSEVEARFRRS